MLNGVSSGWAATYHVAVGGVDTNSGTEEKPWRTLSKANAEARAGDTIRIGPGTWNEDITISQGGGDGNPISWVGSGKMDTICARFKISKPFVHIREMTIQWQVDTNAPNVLVENILFTWTGGRQFWIQPTGAWSGPVGVVARGCEFIGCGTAGAVSVNGNDCLIEKCFFTTGNGGDAIYLNGRRNIVRGCIFKGWSRPSGSKQHTDLFQSYSNNGEISEDHLIEGNFAIDCSGTQIGNVTDLKQEGKIRGWTWRNNIFIRVSNPLNLYCADFRFENNTFYQTPTGAGACVLVKGSTDRGVAHNCEFYNNIFYKGGANPSSTSQGFWGFDLKGQTLNGFKGDNNLVLGEGVGVQKGVSWTWFGVNANSLNGVDPLFVNPTNPTKPEDLYLRQGSPAIGAGKNLSDIFTTDFSGRRRMTRWDIGAHQIGGSLSAPTGYRAPLVGEK